MLFVLKKVGSKSNIFVNALINSGIKPLKAKSILELISDTDIDTLKSNLKLGMVKGRLINLSFDLTS